MRIIIATFASLMVLTAVSVQAAPLAPAKASVGDPGIAPPIERVRDGCGHGWHRHHWRDQWGYWHWGDCIPDGDPPGGWGMGWYYPYPDWRDARPWGWRNP